MDSTNLHALGGTHVHPLGVNEVPHGRDGDEASKHDRGVVHRVGKHGDDSGHGEDDEGERCPNHDDDVAHETDSLS